MRRQPAAPKLLPILMLLCLVDVWVPRSQAAFSLMSELSGSQRCIDKFAGCQHTGEQRHRHRRGGRPGLKPSRNPERPAMAVPDTAWSSRVIQGECTCTRIGLSGIPAKPVFRSHAHVANRIGADRFPR